MGTDNSVDNDPQPTRFYSVPVSSFYERGGDVSDEAFKKWSAEIVGQIESECAADGVKAIVAFDESDEAQRAIAKSLNAMGRSHYGTARTKSE